MIWRLMLGRLLLMLPLPIISVSSPPSLAVLLHSQVVVELLISRSLLKLILPQLDL